MKFFRFTNSRHRLFQHVVRLFFPSKATRSLVFKFPVVPDQNNGWDCGFFTLYFILLLRLDFDEFMRVLRSNELRLIVPIEVGQFLRGETHRIYQELCKKIDTDQKIQMLKEFSKYFRVQTMEQGATVMFQQSDKKTREIKIRVEDLTFNQADINFQQSQ